MRGWKRRARVPIARQRRQGECDATTLMAPRAGPAVSGHWLPEIRIDSQDVVARHVNELCLNAPDLADSSGRLVDIDDVAPSLSL